MERVRSRVGHGFGDLGAARHMHREFATANISVQYVMASTAQAETVASSIFELVVDGADQTGDRRGRAGATGSPTMPALNRLTKTTSTTASPPHAVDPS